MTKNMYNTVINGAKYITTQDAKFADFNKYYNESNVGVAITTHNRPELLKTCLSYIRRFTPNAKVVIVDDASDNIVDANAEVFRFNENVGIAKAKNKCLELLASKGCTDFFLFDDDTWPIRKNWWVPYVSAKEHHLMYLFENWANGEPVGDDRIIYRDANIVAHEHARGCMLYCDRRVLEVVGGMETSFGKAMNEHGDWSNRIYNAGLTSFKYVDVPGSNQLIYSSDEHKSVKSSIPYQVRRQGLLKNQALIETRKNSVAYGAFGKNVVIACYFAGFNDSQRGVEWKPDLAAVQPLKKSVENLGYEFILIHNCFNLPNRVQIYDNPYWARWYAQYIYLRDHIEINKCFVVDSTDVEMKNDPFDFVKVGRLYVGSEQTTQYSSWMRQNFTDRAVVNSLRINALHPLMNCGVVGGTRHMVMEFCKDMYEYYFNSRTADKLEMGYFNYLCNTKYRKMLEYGNHITSQFKAYDNNTRAWFRHK